MLTHAHDPNSSAAEAKKVAVSECLAWATEQDPFSENN